MSEGRAHRGWEIPDLSHLEVVVGDIDLVLVHKGHLESKIRSATRNRNRGSGHAVWVWDAWTWRRCRGKR